MKRICWAFLAASSLCGIAGTVSGSTRPHYGGTLRVEMRDRVASLDPREISEDAARAASAERLASLMFDRLVELDENGEPRPSLASSWLHDAQFKRWEFRMRPNAIFSDGAPVTARAVVVWWNAWHAERGTAGLAGEGFWIELETPSKDFPLELAQGRNFVFRVGGDGVISGSGAFRIAEWQAGRKLAVTANEVYWGGRPYVDRISVEMGISAQQQMIDLELGKADLVEIAPEQARRAAQNGRRLWSSSPVELYALVFDSKRSAATDPRVRQALSLAIDRASIANVLLQRQGEAAGSLLPQWLSGYAFLFDTTADVERAKGIVKEISPTPRTITLSYIAADPLAKTVAERVALNARDAGITVVIPATGTAASVDVRMVRLRLQTIDAARALESLASAAGVPAAQLPVATSDPQELYGAERAAIESGRIVPLVYMPETVGLGAQVRNWLPRRWDEWRLADVWLDTTDAKGAAAASPQNANPR